MYELSKAEATQSAKEDPDITFEQLAFELDERARVRDAKLSEVSERVDLMRKAQNEANKPMLKAAEAAGIVLQDLKQEVTVNYEDLIKQIGEMIPKEK
jgi:hypothetical protein